MPWATTSAPPQSTISEIWPVLLILVGVVLVGFIMIGIVRRWMKSDSSDEGVGFTLSDLRRLHAEGKLSREELEVAERQMIAKVREHAGDVDAVRIRRKPPPQNRNDPQSPTEEEE